MYSFVIVKPALTRYSFDEVRGRKGIYTVDNHDFRFVSIGGTFYQFDETGFCVASESVWKNTMFYVSTEKMKVSFNAY